MTPKLSVIIPAYNAAAWIRSCLDSLPAIPEVEIIVVDDGSIDATGEICRKDYPQVRFFQREHAGQGAARNFGLTQATGDYIWFVDADDLLPDAAADRLFPLTDSAPDIIAICGANLIDGRAVRRFSWKGMAPCSGKDFLLKGKLQRGTPFSVYRREFLLQTGAKFPEGIYHEDAVFTPCAWYNAEKVVFTDEILYLVRLTPGSTTRSGNTRRAFDSVEAQKLLSAFAAKSEPLYRRAFDSLIASDMNHALKNCYGFGAEFAAEFNRCLYHNRVLFRHLKGARELKFRLEYLAFSLCPHHTVQVYKFLELFNPSRWRASRGV